MVATLKSSSSVEQLVDSLSPAQREELMQLLAQKAAR
jgi:hypothetical protein